MMNKNERMDALKNAGLDAKAFIAMGLPEGAKVTIDLPGGVTQEIELMLKKFEDMDAIKADPYFSRWTMAQVFDVLRSGESVPEYLKRKFSHPYRYQFTQTLDRLKEIAKLPLGERKDILAKFFNNTLALELARGYMKDLREYVDGLPAKSHRGTPYKRIPGFGDVHVKDIEGIVYAPLEKQLERMEDALGWTPVNTSFAIAFEGFINRMVKFDDTKLKLNPKFVAAYQGRGAYLTLTGLIEFHGCRVYPRTKINFWRAKKEDALSKADSLEAVKNKVNEIERRPHYYSPIEWYQLWGMMKEMIEDNDFDFYKVMAAKYGK